MPLQPAPAVTALQAIVVALATPLLLLSADLSVILKRTGLMLRVFVCGAIGTALGALLGFWLVRSALHIFCVREKLVDDDDWILWFLLVSTCAALYVEIQYQIGLWQLFTRSTVRSSETQNAMPTSAAPAPGSAALLDRARACPVCSESVRRTPALCCAQCTASDASTFFRDFFQVRLRQPQVRLHGSGLSSGSSLWIVSGWSSTGLQPLHLPA